MNKWYFSNNGEINGPFDLASAKKILLHNTNLYGWNPTYSQWKPVSMISEFSDVVPVAKPQAQIPKELISKFISKKRNLHDRLEVIDNDFILVNTLLCDLGKEIQTFNNLTLGLNDEIISIINNIEQNYISLRKKRSDVIQAVNIAKLEINDAVKEFSELVVTKVENITTNGKNIGITTSNMIIKNNTTIKSDNTKTNNKAEHSFNEVSDTLSIYQPEKRAFAAVKSIFSFAS